MKLLRSFSTLALVGAFSVGTAACSAPGSEGGDGDGDTGGDGDGGDGDGGDGDGGDGDAGHTGAEGNLEEARLTCETSRVGPPVLRRLTQAEVEASLRDIFNLSDWSGVKLSPDPSSALGFTNDASVLVVGGNTAKEMLKTAEEVADLVVDQLGSVLPCSQDAADRACVEEFVNQYGLRLFRRPVGADEVGRYADFQASVEGRSAFATGMKWMVTTMIQSPHAFYRSEIGEEDGSGIRQLDDYEMASELSYMLTGSTPDGELLDQAASGALSDPSARRAQAERLLSESGHPRYLDGLRTFFNEWLHYRTVVGQSRDDDPLFAQDISPLMVDETRLFLDTLVFGKKGTIRDLMTADFTALNRRLSEFYGYGDVTSDSFVEVQKPAQHGMGILAQGSLLAATSHQGASSPTQRALLFTERFLCMEAPAPPANVPTIEETQEVDVNTTREKYEVNHANPSTACGTCHIRFEPFGYVFEQFDETGRHREDEDGFPISTAVDNAPLPDGSVASYANLDELSLIVDSSEDVQNCFSGLLAAYMFSGAGGEHCLAEEARADAATGAMSIYDLVLSLTEAPHFSTRE